MKRLVSILLFVFAVATGFAQSSTPDYIQKAKIGLNQYYPQFKDYFEPIFGKIMGLRDNTRSIINTKTQENIEIFSDDIDSEKDKIAIILLVFERIVGTNQFQMSPAFAANDEDVRVGIAQEICSDIRNQIKKSTNQTLRESNRIEEQNAKLKEILNSVNVSERSKETDEIVVSNIEDYFCLLDVSEIKGNTGLQKIISIYIIINNSNNRQPSPLGQKFIDEYNRIIKSK